jgi:uncharacterized protein with GYD domain
VEDGMLFITLAKFKGKPTKESVALSEKMFKQMTEEGAKIIGVYWTLGRYDAVAIIEGPDEKTAMRSLLRWGDMLSTETLIAVTREEAAKLVE